jgi:undecaprenyl-diphosphatase
MEIFTALLLAVVQGITEWLPISSSGHLAIVQHFFGIEETVAYDVILHLGSLVAVFIVFFKDILKNFLDIRRLILIIIGTIPIVIVGLLIKPYIQGIFNNLLLVGSMLILTAFILYFSGRGGNKKIENRSSFFVGLFQAAAILPGISRSGSTIAGGLLLGLKKEEALKFSFMLSIPAIIGAMILNLNDITSNIDINMIIGLFVCIIISYIFIKILISFVMKKGLKSFSYYCFSLGFLILVYSLTMI